MKACPAVNVVLVFTMVLLARRVSGNIPGLMAHFTTPPRGGLASRGKKSG